MPKSAPFWISVHIGDYLRKTPGFGPGTWEYHGIYWQLRFLAWNTPGCRLPTDPLWISRHTGCTLEIFKEKVLPVLERQFVRRNNWYYDEDLSTVHTRATEFGKLQSHRSKQRKNKEKDASQRPATSLLPSLEHHHHTKPASAVGKKKKTKRYESSHLFAK